VASRTYNNMNKMDYQIGMVSANNSEHRNVNNALPSSSAAYMVPGNGNGNGTGTAANAHRSHDAGAAPLASPLPASAWVRGRAIGIDGVAGNGSDASSSGVAIAGPSPKHAPISPVLIGVTASKNSNAASTTPWLRPSFYTLHHRWIRPRFLIRVFIGFLLTLIILFVGIGIAGGNSSCGTMDPALRSMAANICGALSLIGLIILSIQGWKISKHDRDGMGIKKELTWTLITGFIAALIIFPLFTFVVDDANAQHVAIDLLCSAVWAWALV
jgi:hypothetical protein